ncbi:MAG: TonB-dependent receptor [Bacteroidota bacterium]
MKRFLVTLFICASYNILSAQVQIEVTGQVKDNQTKKALEFCSVSVFNPADSLITGSVTDNNGFFAILLESGNYYFIFSYIGYETDTTELITMTEKKFLGVFKLNPNEKLLNELTVKASSYDNLIDKDVQIVTDKMKAGASNTKDVLDKINGVDYDRYNNSIKVDNDANVMILVDGLEKDQEYIKNLSPDRLKKIEVIRDPGGRYALEGYSAVINIILKKDYKGTELYLYERVMTDPDSRNNKYFFIQNSSAATLNYVYNKFNVYGKYSNDYSNFNIESTGLQEYANGLVIEKNPVVGDVLNATINEFSNNYTLGADYYMNPKHTFSFESTLSTLPSDKNMFEERYDVNYLLNGILIDNVITDTKNNSENTSSYNSLFYTGKFDEKNSLNSNFTFSDYKDNYTNTYKENFIDKRIEDGTNHKNSTEFYLEYDHTFSTKTNLQIGYGNTWEKLDNKYTIESSVSQFEYADIRHKLYSYYSWQKSKKISIKTGVAAETSSPNANGQKNSYLIFQPYTDIKFKPSEILDLKLKYRSASNYPNISQTNPFTYVLDPQTVRTGNPYLRPEVTHKVSLQTHILGGLMMIEPYYHFSGNYITEIGTLRSDSIFEYSYSNIGKYTNYGIQANVTIPFGKSLFLQSDFDFYKSSIEYEGKTNRINDWAMSNQLVYVNEKSGLVAGFQYQNNLRKFITAQGYNMGDNDFWIVFFQQPFFKKKLSLMLVYFTPITWGVDFIQGNYINTDTYTESKFYDISILKNIVMLEISYRFNKGKSVTKTEKNIERKKEKTSKGLF